MAFCPWNAVSFFSPLDPSSEGHVCTRRTYLLSFLSLKGNNKPFEVNLHADIFQKPGASNAVISEACSYRGGYQSRAYHPHVRYRGLETPELQFLASISSKSRPLQTPRRLFWKPPSTCVPDNGGIINCFEAVTLSREYHPKRKLRGEGGENTRTVLW